MVLMGLVLALMLLAGVLMMLLRRTLKEKYAVPWLILGVLLLILGLFPDLLSALTGFFGVHLPVNLLFAAAIIVLLFVSIYLSRELSQNEDQARRLAEEVAILGARADDLEARLGAHSPVDGDTSPKDVTDKFRGPTDSE